MASHPINVVSTLCFNGECPRTAVAMGDPAHNARDENLINNKIKSNILFYIKFYRYSFWEKYRHFIILLLLLT